MIWINGGACSANYRLTGLKPCDYNSWVLCAAPRLLLLGASRGVWQVHKVMLDSAKPLRTVLRWQVVATALLAVIGAWLAGGHGALSALLGGAVAIAGGMVFAFLARPPKALSRESEMAWDGLAQILKAEGAKVLVIVVLLGLVLAMYKEVVLVGFIGSFIVAVIIFSMAIFLRNPAQIDAGKQNVD